MLSRLAIGLGLLALLVPVAAMADGAPDPAFDQGRAATFAPQRFSYATGAAVDGQGRTLIAAVVDDGTLLRPRGAVLRLLADGSLDATFGVGGIATVEPPPGYVSTRAEAMVLDPAGRIVIAGEVEDDIPAVMRLLPDGSPDPAFGTGGVVVERGAYAGGPAWWESIALDGSQIVVGGDTANTPPYGTGLDRVAVLARFDDSGVPDPSFGSGGFVQVPLPGITLPSPHSLAVDHKGRIIMGISMATTATFPREVWAQVLRFGPSGSLDPAFGSAGVVTLGLQRAGAPMVVLRPTGEIMAVGDWGKDLATPPTVMAAQLLTSGGLDPAFAAGGQITEQQATTGSGVLDCQGDLIVTGSRGVRRFGRDGRLDATFRSPAVRVAVGTTTAAAALDAVALEPGGAVVLAGSATDGPVTIGGAPGTQIGATSIVVAKVLATCPQVDAKPPTVVLTCAAGCRRVSGSALDDPIGSGVRRVLLGIEQRRGRRCRAWNGRRFAALPCSRAPSRLVAVPVVGGTFRSPPLPAGSCVVRAVAVDGAGNRSRIATRKVTR
jgi:uncharacterized delta-60 repeat protein